MSNLYTEPTKDDLVYFAQRVVAALNEHVPGWRITTLRCPTYTDCATEAIRQLAQGRKLAALKAAYGYNPYNAQPLRDDYDRLVAKAYRKQESRVIAHMVEWLGKQYSKTTERADDQGAAHGLRQHSIGSTYPCVVVGSIIEGVTHYHVEFAGYRSFKATDGKLVHRWAERIAQQYRIMGWTLAVDYFRDEYFFKGPVERRYG